MSIPIKKENREFEQLVKVARQKALMPMQEAQVRHQPPGTYIVTGDKFGPGKPFGSGPSSHGIVVVRGKPIGTVHLSSNQLGRGLF